MNGRKNLPIKDWQAEQKKLLTKRYSLCDRYYSLESEIHNAEVIQRSVKNLMLDDLQKEQPTRTKSKTR